MNKQPDKTSQTKEDIREAFWQLYTVKPLSAITVRDICTQAGYSRGTFYRYYNFVDDVLEQIECEILNQFDMRFDQIARCSRHLDLFGLVKHTLAPCKIYNKYLAVMLGANGDPDFQARLREKAKAVLRNLMAIKYGELNETGEFCLEFCVSGLLSCTRMWYEQKSNMDINDYISMMLQILTEPLGILSSEITAEEKSKFAVRTGSEQEETK